MGAIIDWWVSCVQLLQQFGDRIYGALHLFGGEFFLSLNEFLLLGNETCKALCLLRGKFSSQKDRLLAWIGQINCSEIRSGYGRTGCYGPAECSRYVGLRWAHTTNNQQIFNTCNLSSNVLTCIYIHVHWKWVVSWPDAWNTYNSSFAKHTCYHSVP